MKERFPLIIVPGPAASELWLGPRRVWPPGGTSLGSARLTAAGLSPGGLVRSEVGLFGFGFRRTAWSRFIDDRLVREEGYETDRDVFVFQWDWRIDIRVSAQALAAAVEEWSTAWKARTGEEPKFVLMAHLSGALVARWYVDRLGGAARVSRLVLASPLDHGAPAAFTALNGDGLSRWLTPWWALWYTRAGVADRQMIARGMASFFQMLPLSPFLYLDGVPVDPRVEHGWLGDVPHPGWLDALRAGREVQEGLTPPPSVPTTLLFGVGRSAAREVLVGRGPDGDPAWSRAKVVYARGDGLVPARLLSTSEVQAGVEVVWTEGSVLDPVFLWGVLRTVLEGLSHPPHPAGRAAEVVGATLRDAGYRLAGERPARNVVAVPSLSEHAVDPRVVLSGATPALPVVFMGYPLPHDLARSLAWHRARRIARNQDVVPTGHQMAVPLCLDLDRVPRADDPVAGVLAGLRSALDGLLVDMGEDDVVTFLSRVPTVLILWPWSAVAELGLVAPLQARFPRAALAIIDPDRRFDGRPGFQVWSLPSDEEALRLFVGATGDVGPGGQVTVWVGCCGVEGVPLARVAPRAMLRSEVAQLVWPHDPATGKSADVGIQVAATFDGLAPGSWSPALHFSPDAQDVLQSITVTATGAPVEVRATFTLRDSRLASIRIRLEPTRSDLLLEPAMIDLLAAGAQERGLDARLGELSRFVPAGVEATGSAGDRLRGALNALNAAAPSVDGAVPLVSWLLRARQMVRRPWPEADDALRRLTQRGRAPQDPSAADLKLFREAVLERDDLTLFRFLSLAQAAGAAIAKLRVPSLRAGVPLQTITGGPRSLAGTGWLVAPGLMVTNHHVVASRLMGEDDAADADIHAQALGCDVIFGYDDPDAEVVTARVTGLVALDRSLDYALLRIEGAPAVAPLRLWTRALKGSAEWPLPVNIIQHPGGGPKKIAFRNNLATWEDGVEIRYFTDTEEGSSGSPVLDDAMRVVALHRASLVVPATAEGERPVQYNVGTTSRALLDHLKANFPEIYTEITGKPATG